MLYRIITESKVETIQHLHNIVAGTFPDGFTAIYADGRYNGERRSKVIFEIVTNNALKIYTLADELCKANNSENVMVQSIGCNCWSIDKTGLANGGVSELDEVNLEDVR